MRKLGYVRISEGTLSLEEQLELLNSSGCESIVVETAGGKNSNRPNFSAVMAAAAKGDCIVVARLDRLALHLTNLIEIIATLHKRGINLISIEEKIDTAQPGHGAALRIFPALEMSIQHYQRERIGKAQKYVVASGVKRGRKASFTSADQEIARNLFATGNFTRQKIAEKLGVHPSTISRLLGRNP